MRAYITGFTETDTPNILRFNKTIFDSHFVTEEDKLEGAWVVWRDCQQGEISVYNSAEKKLEFIKDPVQEDKILLLETRLAKLEALLETVLGEK